MAEIKTLTVNGKTYTVTDPAAARIDDGAVGENTWSSRKITEVFTQAQGENRQSFANAVKDTASGDVISVSDASNAPIQELTLYGKTIQAGTPTPENPVELVSAGTSGSIGVTVAGKNLFDDIGWFESNGFTKQSDGSWLAFPISKPCFTNAAKQKGAMYITATVSAYGNPAIPMYIIVYYTDGTTYNAVSAFNKEGFITTTSKTDPEKTIDYIKWGYGGSGVYYIKDVMFSFADNEYEPYKKAQTLTASTPNGLPGIPVSSGGNYTDASGQQWICDEVDFARGVHVQRISEMVLDGSSDEQWSEEQYSAKLYSLSIPGMLIQASAYEKPYVLCDRYEVFPQAVTFSSYNTAIVGRANYSKVSFINQNVDDLAGFKALLAERSVTILYALATPIETALTAEEIAAFKALHTNKPNTTVFNDGGAGLGLEYIADTKIYIDNKFTELQNAILSAGANI